MTKIMAENVIFQRYGRVRDCQVRHGTVEYGAVIFEYGSVWNRKGLGVMLRERGVPSYQLISTRVTFSVPSFKPMHLTCKKSCIFKKFSAFLWLQSE